MAARPFRFGVVAAAARSPDEWLAKARRVEALGFSTLVVPDNLRFTLAPWPALTAAATATSTLRVGTYVLDNDYRHPVLVAKDAACVDLLSGGRLELGIGAGRPDAAADNRMLGLGFDSGRERVAKLGEAIALLKRALAGQAVPASAHYPVDGVDVSPRPVQQPHPPLLVAGGGQQMLRLAAREADIVALGLAPDATEAAAAERIRWLREAAADRFEHLELNLNLMAVADQVPRFVSTRMGVSAADLARAGAVSALVGSADAMSATLLERRERLGISYLLVSDELMDAFAPVVERLAGR